MHKRVLRTVAAVAIAVAVLGWDSPAAHAHPDTTVGAVTGQVTVLPTIVAPPACAPTSYMFNSTAIAGSSVDVGGGASFTGTIGVTASGSTACENALTTGVAGASVNVTCHAVAGALVTASPPSAGVVTNISCSLVGTAVRIGVVLVLTLTGNATMCNASACVTFRFGPTLPAIIVATGIPIHSVPPNLNGPVNVAFAGMLANLTV